MNSLIPTLLKSQSKRTTFLSEGVKLCGIVCAICAAPLFLVQDWRAVWLLVIISIIGLGTFGIWAFNAIRNSPLLNSEEHTEQMAAIAVLGHNRDGKPPLIEAIDQTVLISNPDVTDAQENGRG